MKNLAILFSSICLLASAQQKAIVTKIIDGDTYDLFLKGRTVRVRLANVDAPETKQFYGTVVTAQVTKLLNWKLVFFDSVSTDLYGRVVGTLKFNGMRVDSVLVRMGWAWYNPNYGKAELLNKCMQLAINESKGLWICGKDNVCAPWLYRKYKAEERLKYCKGCLKIY